MNTSYYGTNTTYGYDYGAVKAFGTGMLIFVGILWLIAIAVSILQLVSIWKVFKKAGKPGWASIIPIYNVIVLFDIVGRKWWTLFLMMIPFYNIYLLIMINIELAKKFGKSSGFGIGLTFIPVIFYPILAFGKENVAEKEETNVSNESNSIASENTNVQSNLDENNSNISSQLTENNFNITTEQNSDINTEQDFVNSFSNEPWPPVSGFNNTDKQPDFINAMAMNNELDVPTNNTQNSFDNNYVNSEINNNQNQSSVDTMNAVSEALNTIDTLNNKNENNILFGANEFNSGTTQENVEQVFEQPTFEEQPVIQTPANEEINQDITQNNTMFNNDINTQQQVVLEQVNEPVIANNDEINMNQLPNIQDSIQQAQNEVMFNNDFNEKQNIQTPTNEEIMDFEVENMGIDNINLNQGEDSNN